MMKKDWKTLLAVLSGFALIMACSFGAGVDEPANVTEAEPTMAPTAAPTLEPTAEPTAEPVEEPAAEPIPPAGSEISDLALTTADFPGVNFVEVTMAEMGFSLDQMNSDEFTVESFFAMLEQDSFELVMGFTTLVTSPLDQAGFDLVLRQPDIVTDAFIGGMGETDASDPEELPELTNTVGDASVGLTLITDAVEGIGFRVDTVVFRRGSVGAFLVIIYLDGEDPVVPLIEIAEKFDARIGEFLAE